MVFGIKFSNSVKRLNAFYKSPSMERMLHEKKNQYQNIQAKQSCFQLYFFSRILTITG